MEHILLKARKILQSAMPYFFLLLSLQLRYESNTDLHEGKIMTYRKISEERALERARRTFEAILSGIPNARYHISDIRSLVKQAGCGLAALDQRQNMTETEIERLLQEAEKQSPEQATAQSLRKQRPPIRRER